MGITQDLYQLHKTSHSSLRTDHTQKQDENQIIEAIIIFPFPFSTSCLDPKTKLNLEF